jgi:3-hydroxyisobutyrate dehydrogenase-like beta-hydroxyacid dehydrogenase
VEAGYLGVGNMGQPMAHKLLDARRGLTIYDINEAAGRTFARALHHCASLQLRKESY